MPMVAAVTAMQIRQMGRIMEIELENTDASSVSVNSVSSGTSTRPPPAPNRPATSPAQVPATTMPNFVLRKKIPPAVA